LFMGSFFMLFCGALILLCISIIVQVYQLKTIKNNKKLKKIIIQLTISLIVVVLFFYMPQTN
jgi:ABC-type phosphate transport system permease subunit